MKIETAGRILNGALIAVIFAASSVGVLRADDTEIYRASFSDQSSLRPRVLVIFDDSGSMSTVVPGQRPAYDPETTYNGPHESTVRLPYNKSRCTDL